MTRLNDAPETYTFDDVQLIPAHSEVMSRKDPSVKVNLPTLKVDIPIISSPMNTITEFDMANTMLCLGGSAVLHRYMSIECQIEIVKKIKKECSVGSHLFEYGANNFNNFFVAVGANEDTEARVSALLEVGITSFCIDVANGHSAHCLKAVELIKKLSKITRVMAGNVCSYEGALNLARAGADLIRVGLGSGSVCTTRLVTGHGVPQLSAIEECAKIKWKGNGHSDNSLIPSDYNNVVIISDGGIRSTGDAVKALAIGADVVMIGGMLAGTSDTPGKTHKDHETGMLYKYYHGMASSEGRESWFDRSKTSFVPEGESIKVPYKGKTEPVIENLVGGLKVGMSYAGAFSLEELRSKAKWIRVSRSGVIEGMPYGKR